MDPEERPFPCKIDGCKLSFATEDHLNAHRKKHDILLNLELPNKSNLFADQTPTPTRLIGKCEEVGLFEDLQHVNPFEETFRRAVEEKSSGSGESAQERDVPVIGPIGTGDDTLHTPHVFPLLERRDSRKLSKLIISRSSSRKDDIPATTSQSALASESRTTSKRKQQFVNPISNKKQPVNILPKATPSSQPVIIISCERDERLSVIKTTSPLHPVKAKLKKYLARNGSLTELQQPSVQSTASNTTTSTLNAPKKTKPAATVSEDNTPRSHVSEEASIQKHERWKAAAKRYRTRVKQNQDCIHRKNVDLQEENLRLKTELAQLKSALSLHKDCSVTRALIAGTNMNAAGPSKVMLIPVDDAIHHRPEQHHSVETQVVGSTVAVSSNPVYIIIGGINALPEAGNFSNNKSD